METIMVRFIQMPTIRVRFMVRFRVRFMVISEVAAKAVFIAVVRLMRLMLMVVANIQPIRRRATLLMISFDLRTFTREIRAATVVVGLNLMGVVKAFCLSRIL
jgi:hypothetical protein